MEFITVQEAADRLGVSRSTVGRLIDRGELGAYALPTGTIRIDVFDLDAFTRSCRTNPTNEGNPTS